MKRRRRHAPSLPMMVAELMSSSTETIVRRGMMAADGTLSATEIVRMTSEKLQAAQASSLALMSPPGPAMLLGLLAPWHRLATANAKRLRRKRR